MITKEQLSRWKDLMTGERDRYKERYRKIYMKGDHQEIIEKNKRKVFQTYLLILLCFLLVLTGYLAGRHETAAHMNQSGKHVISLTRPDDGSMEMNFRLGILSGQGIDEQEVTIHLESGKDGEAESEDIQKESGKTVEELVREMKKTVEDDPAGKTILLPQTLSDGTHVMWFPERDMKWLLLLLLSVAAMGAVYAYRFNSIRKEEETAAKVISLELPGFINKLVLMLNGGLILFDALERVIGKYQEKENETSYFYDQLSAILENSRQSNTAVEEQMAEFSRNTGVREFIRVTGIMTDNVHKGTSLVEKLEAESEVLWFDRKKKAEEMGKLAETRLTIPLMILLLVLITVTIAPAMLEM